MIGQLAASQRDTLGPWVFSYDASETVTILAGIRARAGDGVEVSYEAGVASVSIIDFSRGEESTPNDAEHSEWLSGRYLLSLSTK